jgi:gamma-glutamylaminecyclotransferase
MPHRHLIFVYGTLKRGFCRAHFLAGQLFLAEARTLPKYRMYDCGTYPGLKLCPQNGLAIRGEVWSVDTACLARLDQEEGVAEGLYSRSTIELAGSLPESVAASPIEAYYYGPAVAGYPDCGEQWIEGASDRT